MASADSASGEPSSGVFAADRVTTVLPRHEVVKLDEGTYLQWRKQVKLIVNGYGLAVFTQQDQLLMSWLLSTVTSSHQSSFDDACTACDIWSMAGNLFAADTGAKQSRIRHELHALKKGNLSIKAYVARIKDLCAMLDASGSRISDEEKIEVVLAGLPSEFEAVISSARLSPVVLPLQRLVDALVDCESRQDRVLQEVSLNANLVENELSVEGAGRGGRASVRGRGRFIRSRVQCQICSRFDSNEMSGVEGCDSGTFVQNGDEQMVVPHQKSQRIFYGQGSHAGQNRYVSQNVCAGMQNRSLPRGPHVFNAQNDAYKPSLSKFGHDAGQGYSGDTLHGFTTGNGQWRSSSGNKSHGQNVQFNDGPNVQHSSHGPNVQFNAGPNFVPSSNFVQLDQDDPGSPELIGDGLGVGGPVLKFTKPRARVYTGSNPCIGLPRLGDLHASDYSDPSVSDSHVNTAQLASSTGNDDSYIPVCGGTTSWYPNSGASHHVCRDVSDLRNVTPYSGYGDSGDIADGPHS
ncbi:hypothetical protein V6Z12_D01G195700 [Gossypium hirsutum]